MAEKTGDKKNYRKQERVVHGAPLGLLNERISQFVRLRDAHGHGVISIYQDFSSHICLSLSHSKDLPSSAGLCHGYVKELSQKRWLPYYGYMIGVYWQVGLVRLSVPKGFNR